MFCVPQSLEAKTTYVAHQGVVEDVAWHQHHTDIFGSVGDDKQLILWDTRKPPRDGEQLGNNGQPVEALNTYAWPTLCDCSARCAFWCPS